MGWTKSQLEPLAKDCGCLVSLLGMYTSSPLQLFITIGYEIYAEEVDIFVIEILFQSCVSVPLSDGVDISFRNSLIRRMLVHHLGSELIDWNNA